MDDGMNEVLADACAEFVRCWSMYQQNEVSSRRLALMSARGRLMRTVGSIRKNPLAHFPTAELKPPAAAQEITDNAENFSA